MTAPLVPGWDHRTLRDWHAFLGVPRLELHAELSSTNDRARELAREGSPPFTTVVAHRQTAGRGRGGKGWSSPAGGGLWISVLLPEPMSGPPGVATLAVGVAAAQAIERLAIGVRVGLKWPNDLMVRDPDGEWRKLGGILCEAVAGEPGGSIVAGIGINLRRGPVPVPGSADGSVGHSSAEPSPPPVEGAAFLDGAQAEDGTPVALAGVPSPDSELAHELLAALRRWADPPPDQLEGALRQEWERRDILAGRFVRLEVGPVGRALGVALDGSLRIAEMDGALRSVSGGGVRLYEGPQSQAEN